MSDDLYINSGVKCITDPFRYDITNSLWRMSKGHFFEAISILESYITYCFIYYRLAFPYSYSID